MKRIKVAHFQEDNSDKVYIIAITDNSSVYSVNTFWGGYGKKLSSQIKLQTVNLREATNMMAMLFAAKVKKGYVDIESYEYKGRLDSKCRDGNGNWLVEQLTTHGVYNLVDNTIDYSTIVGNQTAVREPEKALIRKLSLE